MNLDYETALQVAEEGKTMPEIAAALGCSYRELNREVKRNDWFGRALAQAREFGWHLRAEKLATIVTDNPDMDVQRLKLISDNQRWLLARLLPSVYGDRIDVKVERVDVSIALTEAKNRLLRPSCDPALIEDVEVIELPRQSASDTTDKQSVATPMTPEKIEDPFSD